MATIKEIGARLNLSPATVSRALNGYPEVSAKTRRLVEDTARELNYQPNQVAQKLATGRSGMVGLVLPLTPDKSFDPTFYDVMTGLSTRLTELQLDLVFHAPFKEDELEPYRRLVGKRAVDAFIITSPKMNDPRIDFLRNEHVPFVVHGRDANREPDYPYFDIDNFKVGRDTTNLLLDLGHRAFLFLNGPEDVHFSNERRRGFDAALAEHTQPGVRAEIRHAHMTETFGYTQTLGALSDRGGTRPTAIICASTVIAAGVVRAVRDKGLAIPKDISVVAHDDAAPQLRAVSFSPALTVTRSPLRDACEPLADMVQAILKGKDIKSLQVTCEADFIVRQSTGPAPGGGSAASDPTDRLENHA